MIAEPKLVEAACGGDVTAVEKLLVVCQPDLRRFARRACSTNEDAEDAVQIALWQLYRKIGALRTAATFASWLFRIIERECYRLFHARDRLQALDETLDAVLRRLHLALGARYHNPSERDIALGTLRREWAIRKQPGIVEIDTSYLSEDEMVEAIASKWREKSGVLDWRRV